MVETNDIHSQLEDGTYFSECLTWYNQVFVLPTLSRISYLWLIAISVISCCISGMIISNILPLEVKKTIVIPMNRDVDSNIRLERLHRYGYPSMDILSKVVENYVIQRESIKNGNDAIDRKLRFVKISSSLSVYDTFQSMISSQMDTLNAIVASGGAKVKVIGSDFINRKEDNIFNKIMNYFTPVTLPDMAWVDFVFSNSKNQEVWRAKLSYNFRLPTASNYKIPMYFIVTEYSVSKRPITSNN